MAYGFWLRPQIIVQLLGELLGGAELLLLMRNPDVGQARGVQGCDGRMRRVLAHHMSPTARAMMAMARKASDRPVAGTM